ncbi:Bug family tripartite tricarboxylate transporter substrate binding protein [Catelliglobosispora koreensis]|uniref:Bug family tripartite tricarboxylate transporter substrate binding protein n=1 Tax=Catelliglobosispora koreensis TaxID=129052 RepID=UPI00058EBA9A|nr:tripartite tricarboxylate transporter substrate binding protein [Catelliglobosispora koreensis]
MNNAFSRRSLLRAGAGLGAGAILAGCSVKKDDPGQGSGAKFPERAVEWVVPFAAGGSTDLIARMLAKSLEKPLGQTVLVVNKEGAAGAVGTKDVISGTPDGYRMAFPPSSLFTITPHLQQSATKIGLDELRIVTGLTVENICFIVHKDSKYKTIDDLLNDKGAKIKFAHSGVGTGSYLSQVLFFKQAGFDATDVPFGGTGPAVTAVLGKQVDIAASHVAESHKQVASGDLRRLAVFTDTRMQLLPDVPTAKEKGIDVVVDQMRFACVPPKVSDDVAKVLENAFREAVKTPEYGKFLNDNYIERRELSGVDLTAKIKADSDRYKAALAKFGIATR